MSVDPRYYSAVSQRPGPREHLACSAEDVGGYVLLPGDPDRAAAIATRLDDAREIAFNREFRTFTGTLSGAEVSVVSTGIGGPSAAIAVEELAQLGVHTFVRVGTCGALQPDVHVGDLVVATAAVRDEGTSHRYVPAAYPAVSTHEVVDALLRSAPATSRVHRGVVHTTDTFYGQHEPDRMPIAAELTARIDQLRRMDVLCSEMETATVLVVGGAVARGRVGSILAVAGNKETGEHLDDDAVRDRRDQGVDDAISTALGGVRLLVERDRSGIGR